MAKGDVEIDGVPCSFDETTGIGLNLAWKQENGKDYRYENGQRQGLEGRGKGDLMTPESDGLVLAGQRCQRRKGSFQGCLPGNLTAASGSVYDANGQMTGGLEYQRERYLLL